MVNRLLSRSRAWTDGAVLHPSPNSIPTKELSLHSIQLDRMNGQFFKGALRPSPCFDLFVVTWYYDEAAERTPISEFTRDIAEVAKRIIVEQSEVATSLNDIVCLRMNPNRFDGRMRFDWRV